MFSAFAASVRMCPDVCKCQRWSSIKMLFNIHWKRCGTVARQWSRIQCPCLLLVQQMAAALAQDARSIMHGLRESSVQSDRYNLSWYEVIMHAGVRRTNVHSAVSSDNTTTRIISRDDTELSHSHPVTNVIRRMLCRVYGYLISEQKTHREKQTQKTCWTLLRPLHLNVCVQHLLK